MKILMMNNIGSMGVLLKRGLEKLGHTVDLTAKNEIIYENIKSINYSYLNIFKKKQKYDIVHIHGFSFRYMVLKLLSFVSIFDILRGNTKIVYHWHGTRLRNLEKTPLFWKSFIFRFGSYHLYSTIDLSYHLRYVDKNKQMLFRCCIDTELFRPMNIKNKIGGKYILAEKRKLETKNPIPHYKMPMFYNNYDEIEIHNSYNLSPYLLSIMALESGSCGIKVTHHPYLNREWVIKNCSIMGQCKKLEEIYDKIKN